MTGPVHTKWAHAFDFPLEAFQSGRRGWAGGDEASGDGGHEAESVENRDDESVDNEGDAAEMWSAGDREDLATAAELLGDVDDAAEETSAAGDDNTPETYLERPISGLQAAKSAL